ncbi:hypothetical protein CV_4036 [Chromobacterium violaceum ATCC 12472]|uniref:Uncharacterized protein n=1 Tax=Chromobacterium violaceum (strain ATCC 12472 / DSM 30191 / JCM 1249 / CCUG 213 / NBRC 12614 / NCIMB 9131 / NCTC 9757 / MK) TaxID=243365 RepID=Q7NQV1_CHRVO|nr:hypothetical protein CV_4036 [Chromobacterium violaceum ATCC 12472]
MVAGRGTTHETVSHQGNPVCRANIMKLYRIVLACCVQLILFICIKISTCVVFDENSSRYRCRRFYWFPSDRNARKAGL